MFRVRPATDGQLAPRSIYHYITGNVITDQAGRDRYRQVPGLAEQAEPREAEWVADMVKKPWTNWTGN